MDLDRLDKDAININFYYSFFKKDGLKKWEIVGRDHKPNNRGVKDTPFYNQDCWWVGDRFAIGPSQLMDLYSDVYFNFQSILFTLDIKFKRHTSQSKEQFFREERIQLDKEIFNSVSDAYKNVDYLNFKIIKEIT